MNVKHNTDRNDQENLEDDLSDILRITLGGKFEY